MSVSYTKLRDGSWGLRGPGLAPGDEVTVTKRSGETRTETVGRVLWTGPDGTALATIATARRPRRRSRDDDDGLSCGGICPVGGFRCTPDRLCHDCQ